LELTQIIRRTMNPLAVVLKPVNHGWAVALTDGREVARFTGPTARRRALRYVANPQKAG
jgi:hypothetical protein